MNKVKCLLGHWEISEMLQLISELVQTFLSLKQLIQDAYITTPNLVYWRYLMIRWQVLSYSNRSIQLQQIHCKHSFWLRSPTYSSLHFTYSVTKNNININQIVVTWKATWGGIQNIIYGRIYVNYKQRYVSSIVMHPINIITVDKELNIP